MTPSTVQWSAEDSGGQRLLTSWMRPKSLLLQLVRYASPTSVVPCQPVGEYITTVPAVYAAPVPVVEYVSPAPAVSIAEAALTVYAAHGTFVEYIPLATAMSISAPTTVQYATPVKHATPECCAMDSSADRQPSFARTAQEFCDLYVPPPSRKRRPSSVEFHKRALWET